MKVTTYNICLNEKRITTLYQESEKECCQEEHLNRPEKIAYFMWSYLEMKTMAEEYLYMLALDTKCALLGVFEVSHGGVNKAYINPREIYIRALLSGAVYIVLVHNHPSGDPSPSMDDLDVTRRIADAGKIIGIPLTDHIIIGKFRFFVSLKEQGIIPDGGET